MKHKLTVAVVDAFRQPGRAGGVEGGRMGVFVEVREIESGEPAASSSSYSPANSSFSGHRAFYGPVRTTSLLTFDNCDNIDWTRSTNSSLTSSVDEPAWSMV